MISFRQWLSAQTKREDGVGDLARFAVAVIHEWPAGAKRSDYEAAFEAHRELQATYQGTDKVLPLDALRKDLDRAWREWRLALGGQSP